MNICDGVVASPNGLTQIVVHPINHGRLDCHAPQKARGSQRHGSKLLWGYLREKAYIPTFHLLLVAILSSVPPVFAMDSAEINAITQIGDTLSHVRAQEIWPGFNINATPSLVYFSNQHNYAFNFLPTNPHWQKRAQQQEPVYYLENDEYGINDIPFSLGNIIDGQPSYLYRYMESVSAQINIHTFLHERFHLYQFMEFPREVMEYGVYTGFNQVENVKLATLENVILKSYLTSLDINDLQDYSAVNQFRQRLIDTESYQYEMMKEDIEGTAEYYAWNSMVLSAPERNRLMMQALDDKCRLEDIIKCQLHDRYYFTGAVLGIALQQLVPDNWTKILTKDKISIRSQLLQHFPMTQQEREARVAEVKIRYQYTELTEAIERALLAYQQEMAAQQSAYANAEGMVIRLRQTPCDLSGQLMVSKIYWINSDYALNLDVDGIMACADESIKMQFTKLPYLVAGTSFKNEFKFNPSAKIIVNGQEYTLNEFVAQAKSLQFEVLTISDAFVSIKVKQRPGTINIIDGKINLKFE